MAADNHHHDVPAMDYAEHDKTFGLFAGMIKWGTVASLMIVLLAGAATNTISWIFAIVVSVLMTAVVAKFF
jgi:Bacterial aa3 type cytochrome c oxidase subunit IV